MKKKDFMKILSFILVSSTWTSVFSENRSLELPPQLSTSENDDFENLKTKPSRRLSKPKQGSENFSGETPPDDLQVSKIIVTIAASFASLTFAVFSPQIARWLASKFGSAAGWIYGFVNSNYRGTRAVLKKLSENYSKSFLKNYNPENIAEELSNEFGNKALILFVYAVPYFIYEQVSNYAYLSADHITASTVDYAVKVLTELCKNKSARRELEKRNVHEMQLIAMILDGFHRNGGDTEVTIESLFHSN
ncbi:MAG: hypothetical protein LBK29_00900 [Oscillospiraceae bacterium]|jgi:hypothetical protein|nr:hypothetical protein [Oscillospiraceae bacterium]